MTTEINLDRGSYVDGNGNTKFAEDITVRYDNPDKIGIQVTVCGLFFEWLSEQVDNKRSGIANEPIRNIINKSNVLKRLSHRQDGEILLAQLKLDIQYNNGNDKLRKQFGNGSGEIEHKYFMLFKSMLQEGFPCTWLLKLSSLQISPSEQHKLLSAGIMPLMKFAFAIDKESTDYHREFIERYNICASMLKDFITKSITLVYTEESEDNKKNDASIVRNSIEGIKNFLTTELANKVTHNWVQEEKQKIQQLYENDTDLADILGVLVSAATTNNNNNNNGDKTAVPTQQTTPLHQTRTDNTSNHSNSNNSNKQSDQSKLIAELERVNAIYKKRVDAWNAIIQDVMEYVIENCNSIGDDVLESKVDELRKIHGESK